MSGGHFSRGVGLIPPDILDRPITVVGLGGIGSWTLSALSRCGFRQAEVWDHDGVGPENVGGQLYAPSQEGMTKVEAVGVWCLPSLELVRRRRAVAPDVRLAGEVVLSCVDSMRARKAVYEAARASGARYLVDGRMGGTGAQVYRVDLGLPGDVADYERTLHSDGVGEIAPCTERATAYAGSLIAGLMAHRTVALLRGQRPAWFIEIDLGRDEALILDPDRMGGGGGRE